MLLQCSSKLDVRCLTEDTREEPRQSKLDSLLEMASLLCPLCLSALPEASFTPF